MQNKRMSIWIALVMGISLTALLLLAGNAAAKPPLSAVPDTQPHATTTTVWSSGWVTVAAGTCQMFNHNLGTDPEDYVVSILFWDTDGDLGVNLRNYGGLEFGGNLFGVYWEHLDFNTISVCRMSNDIGADQINVRIWIRDEPPDYDSGWIDVSPGSVNGLHHNLGITTAELAVSLWFSGTNKGIHQYGYGSLTIDNPTTHLGAYWRSLTTNTISIVRVEDDVDIEQVRVVVVHSNPPDYDSGWQPIDTGTVLTLTHNLRWPVYETLVRGECKFFLGDDPDINQLFAGGNHGATIGWQGSNLQNLTANTIQVARRANDVACPQIRVRIWRMAQRTYLPLVMRAYP